MSQVVRAYDRARGEDVALKILSTASTAISLSGEFRYIASLNHPGVVSVYDFGLAEDEAALRASLTDGDAGAALRVRDPRDDRAAAAAPDPGVFDAATRAASTDAVRLVRDDVLNAERGLAERRPPLDMPVVVVRARSASPLAAGWDVVAPAGWGRAVFHALVTRGGHAGGDDAVDAAVRARPGRPKKDEAARAAAPPAAPAVLAPLPLGAPPPAAPAVLAPLPPGAPPPPSAVEAWSARSATCM